MRMNERLYPGLSERLTFLYEYVKAERDKDFNKGDWAEEIGVAQSTLSNWMCGTRRPKPDDAERMYHLYQVSLDFIYLGIVDMLPHKMAALWLERPLEQ